MTQISAVAAARPSQLRNLAAPAALLAALLGASSALALDEQSGEAKLIKSCE